jgi:hypothetical protein
VHNAWERGAKLPGSKKKALSPLPCMNVFFIMENGQFPSTLKYVDRIYSDEFAEGTYSGYMACYL